MNDQDRVSIHEVMEQQTVTIAKPGIHASFNARCSVVAVANPIYGTYDHSLTPTKNIGLPDSLLSRFDLLFIVLDQMDPGIDRHISEHVLRMHRFRTTTDVDIMASDSSTQYEREDEAETNSTVFVKYNRMLHGRKASCKHEILTIDFLKKYILYAKHRIQPELTNEVALASDQIATVYAELRSASLNAKNGPGTLPITVRTLETIIRLSTAHAKLRLRRQVLKSDVDAALQVLNFAIYHQELTEMEEPEQERERDIERKLRADNDAGNTDRFQQGRSERENCNAPNKTTEREAIEVDPAETEANLLLERLEAFTAALGRHRHTQHIEQMSVADIEGVVNGGGSVPCSKAEIMDLIEGVKRSVLCMRQPDQLLLLWTWWFSVLLSCVHLWQLASMLNPPCRHAKSNPTWHSKFSHSKANGSYAFFGLSYLYAQCNAFTWCTCDFKVGSCDWKPNLVLDVDIVLLLFCGINVMEVVENLADHYFCYNDGQNVTGLE
ncbi:hypothetical protein ACH5RR_015509 [Cinchona calisaya]|uniref:DNA replication licensing factor MCM3 n=1 Tax=Cinchona calisaya TaxID=153742 RepID=A0ABD2ZWT8_9GENT